MNQKTKKILLIELAAVFAIALVVTVIVLVTRSHRNSDDKENAEYKDTVLCLRESNTGVSGGSVYSRREYDSLGRMIKSEECWPTGEVYNTTVYSYDENDYTMTETEDMLTSVEVTVYDHDGELLSSKRYNKTYDVNEGVATKLVQEIIYGANVCTNRKDLMDSALSLYYDSQPYICNEYNKDGKLIGREQLRYDGDRTLIKEKYDFADGVWRTDSVCELDEQKRLVRKYLILIAGTPEERKELYWEATYEADGSRKEYWPSVYKDVDARVTWYNAQGDMTEQRKYDPINEEECNQRLTWEYGEEDGLRVVTETNYDSQGNPVLLNIKKINCDGMTVYDGSVDPKTGEDKVYRDCRFDSEGRVEKCFDYGEDGSVWKTQTFLYDEKGRFFREFETREGIAGTGRDHFYIEIPLTAEQMKERAKYYVDWKLDNDMPDSSY